MAVVAVMAKSFRGQVTSAEGTTRVKAPRSERRWHEKFKFGHWVWERAVSSLSGSMLSAACRIISLNSAAEFSVFLKFGTWFGHVTADALQTLKVMRSNVKVRT